MQRIREIGKEEILYNLFEEVGTEISVSDALEITGLLSLGSLKTILWKFRSGYFNGIKNIDVSMRNGMLLRVL